jgi:UDP-glucose:(heptosyl)LPS alpha-1,3-glucosyltransferase
MTADGRPVVALIAHGAHERGGGMERVFSELIRRANREYRLIVISRELAPELRRLVEWRRVPVPARPVPLQFSLFYLLAGFRLARTRADLVHTLGALVPNKADIASVHFCHAGFNARKRDERADHGPAVRRINSRVARALGLHAESWSYGNKRIRVLGAVSGGVARELERHYPRACIFVTPNGVDTERFGPSRQARRDLRSAEGLSSEDVVALFVGGGWDHKGLSIAIEALGSILAAGDVPPWLWILGRGDYDRFRGQAERCGVGDRVRFFGVRSDTERFYQAADVLVLPSHYEAFPLVSLEAAACGIPVVATRVNGVEEIIGDDEGGLIVERTPEAFGQALTHLATDRALRLKMGEDARSRAVMFTWERSAASVLEIYRKLLGQSGSRAEVAA